MNNESLRKHLAEKVMGWHEVVLKDCHNERTWVDKDNLLHHYFNAFDPPNNIAQAIECLDNFDGYQIDASLGFHNVKILGHLHKESCEKSLPMAISLACAHATGWEE